MKSMNLTECNSITKKKIDDRETKDRLIRENSFTRIKFEVTVSLIWNVNDMKRQYTREPKRIYEKTLKYMQYVYKKQKSR